MKVEVNDKDRERLRAIHDDLFGDTIGTLQAIGDLSRELKNLKTLLSNGEYEKASSLGYTKIASDFIFLQRCLGGLQKSVFGQDSIVQDLARDNRLSFEEVAPDVEAVMRGFESK
jgi:hypothetical protein